MYVTAILKELTKVFLPRNLPSVLGKLRAFGFSDKACPLIISFLNNMKERGPLGPQYSDWDYIVRGVPQRVILNPLLGIVFNNDIPGKRLDNFRQSLFCGYSERHSCYFRLIYRNLAYP